MLRNVSKQKRNWGNVNTAITFPLPFQSYISHLNPNHHPETLVKANSPETHT